MPTSTSFTSSVNVTASGRVDAYIGEAKMVRCTIAIVSAGSVNLTQSTKPFTAAIALSAGGAVAASVGVKRNVTSSINLTAGGAVDGYRLLSFTSKINISAGGVATLSTTFNPKVAINFTAGGLVTGTVTGQGLLVSDAVKSVTALWSVGCCDTTIDACLLTDIIGRINAALQMIYSQAFKLDYFNRTTLTVTIAANTLSIVLAQNVQTLHGPVRNQTGNVPLMELASTAELEGFVNYYYGGSPPSTPRAYYLDSKYQSGSDNVALKLIVTPVPTADTPLLVDVALEPPRYTTLDASNGTPLEIPHRYAELLLLPIIRKWATGHRMFTRREMQPQIDEQYNIAQAALGLVQPESPTVRKEETPTPKKQ
jgi:hypothetical protein